MQNANDFAKTTANIPSLSNHDVQLNEIFSVSVALQFLAERFSDTSITLINTIQSGYNSYMTLNIPAEHLDNFKNTSGFDDFDDLENFMPLENNSYILYADFPGLSESLDSPLDIDIFY
jgi:hypothetical protein